MGYDFKKIKNVFSLILLKLLNLEEQAIMYPV